MSDSKISKAAQLRELRERAHRSMRAMADRGAGENASVTNPRENTTVLAVATATVAENMPSTREQKLKTARAAVAGDVLKNRLRHVGLSLSAFAELTGTPKRTVEDWSRGATPTPGWVDAKLWILEGSVDALRILQNRG